jgi:hypothetical protein
MRGDITEEDIIVGGDNHLQLLKDCIEQAHSSLVLHSCFLNAATIDGIILDLQRAAARNVRIELIWGLHIDPEEPDRRKPISDFEKALDRMPVELRSRVQLAPLSSGSHCKVILYDNPSGSWSTVISSCNFLSSEFDWIDCSIRTNSQKFAAKVLGRILSTQLPASGAWNPMARRLTVWLLSMLNRSADFGLITALAQVIFSEQLLSRFIRIVWLRAKAEGMYEDAYAIIQSSQKAPSVQLRARVIDCLLRYEAAKALAGISLSTKVFQKLNPALSAEWRQTADALQISRGVVPSTSDLAEDLSKSRIECCSYFTS